MPVDLRKFPLLASENTKLPLDNLTYGSRLKNFYVDDVDTKNYIATAFRNIGDVIQAGELNEIYERQILHDTLTHQMWSNWSAFIYPPDGAPLAPAPTFGPGWAGTTPLYPGAFDANSQKITDTRPYSQVEAALFFETVNTNDIGSGYLQADLKLLFNTGWYLITENTFVTPRSMGESAAANTLYDRVVQASGLKHWYYLKQPILFDIRLLGVNSTGSAAGAVPNVEAVMFNENTSYLINWQNSTKVAFSMQGQELYDQAHFNQHIRDTHDGGYFALDFADKSLCQHIDPVNCEEDQTHDSNDGIPTGSVSDSNPIQTTSIVDDPLFANPININASDDGNSRRVQVKAVPRFRTAINHRMDPLYAAESITPFVEEGSGTVEARARTTNIVLGNMRLNTNPGGDQTQDQVPSYSLCVQAEHNTQGTANAFFNLSTYLDTHAPNMVIQDTFDINEVINLRDQVFQQMKEGVKPRFINNVRVNTTVYDADNEGQTDARNEWNSHFSELNDALVITKFNVDLRQVEPI
tara:strand:- start:47670 stop:49241 length:1572 start_codon:yes stop_codon:yes gene_type:complete